MLADSITLIVILSFQALEYSRHFKDSEINQLISFMNSSKRNTQNLHRISSKCRVSHCEASQHQANFEIYKFPLPSLNYHRAPILINKKIPTNQVPRNCALLKRYFTQHINYLPTTHVAPCSLNRQRRPPLILISASDSAPSEFSAVLRLDNFTIIYFITS